MIYQPSAFVLAILDIRKIAYKILVVNGLPYAQLTERNRDTLPVAKFCLQDRPAEPRQNRTHERTYVCMGYSLRATDLPYRVAIIDFALIPQSESHLWKQDTRRGRDRAYLSHQR